MSLETLHWDISNRNFCLWDWNLESGAIGLSVNWLKFLGYDSHDYESSSGWFNSLIHPEDLALVLFSLELRLSGSDLVEEDFSFRLKNRKNQYMIFESKGIIVLQDDEGAPGHVVWACELIENRVFN